MNRFANTVYIAVHTADPPVDGGWSDWTQWTECSASCDGGTRERTRECNNPPPAYDGQDCDGDNIETEDCNEEECPSESLTL